MHRGIITFAAVAVPVAAASLVLGACGGSATSASAAPGAGLAGGPRPGAAPSAQDMLANVLDPLVDDGTLTGAQADAISQALADAMPGQPSARAPPSPAAEI